MTLATYLTLLAPHKRHFEIWEVFRQHLEKKTNKTKRINERYYAYFHFF